MMARILLAEDDREIANLERDYLEMSGHEVVIAPDGEEAMKRINEEKFDLLILDIMMPKKSGYDICREIREQIDIPILMVTAKTESVDKIRGLGLGADDYIVKPFAVEELLARIRAALRKRPSAPAEALKLTCGALVMDTERHEVTVRGAPVELTRREFDLLHYLLENKEKVISRESLLDHVWGFDFAGETNAVDVYIRFLRSKIDEKFGVKIIHTVRGVGYVVREEDAS